MLLKHLKPNGNDAIQVYAIRGGSGFGNPFRVQTVEEVEWFITSNPDKDLYFNICTTEKVDTGRGDESNMRSLPWLAVDIDTAGDAHKGDRPSLQAVKEMLASGNVVPKPSYVIHTGNGVHCYWVLEEPIDLTRDFDIGKAAMRRVNERIAAWAKSNNWKYEQLKDLARVFRLPGSFNHKSDPPKEVKQVYPTDDRIIVYSLSDFPELPKSSPAPETTFDSENIRIAVAACSKVKPEWNNDGSGYLIKLCAQCVKKGVPGEQSIGIIRNQIASHPSYPTQWTDEQILARYKQAGEQSELGSGITEKLPTSEIELADYLAKKAVGSMHFVKGWNKWVCWDGTHFDRDNVLPLQRLIHRETTDLLSASDEKSWVAFLSRYWTLKGLQAMTTLLAPRLAIEADALDRQHLKFFCSNTVIRLNEDGSMDLERHNPANLNTCVSPVEYDPTATCPRWDGFLKQICVTPEGTHDPDLELYLQMLSGYCLTGRTDIQQIWVLHGAGQNGKGVYTRTMMKLLGSYGISIAQETLVKESEHPSGVARLAGRRAAYAQETDQDCRLNENRVKMLTGNDPISTRRMYEDWWEFQPTHKIFLSTNFVPNIRGSDNGIWRRVKLIPFNAVIPVADPKLEPDIDQELQGVLNWAIRGYELLCEYTLIEPAQVKKCTNEHRESMDIIKQFVQDSCEVGPTATVGSQDLYAALSHYCRRLGQYTPSLRKMNDDLAKLGVKNGRTNKERLKIGIKLLPQSLD